MIFRFFPLRESTFLIFITPIIFSQNNKHNIFSYCQCYNRRNMLDQIWPKITFSAIFQIHDICNLLKSTFLIIFLRENSSSLQEKLTNEASLSLVALLLNYSCTNSAQDIVSFIYLFWSDPNFEFLPCLVYNFLICNLSITIGLTL